MENIGHISNIKYAIDKNDCFLYIFCFFSFKQKYKLKVQVTRPRIIYKIIKLHYLWAIKKCLQQLVVR